MKKIILFIIILNAFFTSCIKDPASNAEADILTFDFPVDSLRSNTIITNEEVIAYPKFNVDLEICPLQITVTQGASYTKINSSEENILFYIQVTSEDGKSTKKYTIRKVGGALPPVFKFDEWIKVSQSANYETPKDYDIKWSSSNNGMGMLWGKYSADTFPVRKTIDSKNGIYAAELRTMSAGFTFPRNMPCVAGSLFLGEFDTQQGLNNPLRSTKFGIPFNQGKPIAFRGWYKYKEGIDGYLINDGSSDGAGSKDFSRHDSCNIYAILFKTDAENLYLYGDNVKNSPRIIAKAQIPNGGNTIGSDFVYFDIPFNYAEYTMPFSMEELKNNQYKIAIVCTSSTQGAYYEGRVGSSLIIDDFQIIIEE